ncbi:MAG: ATP-binding cassette domain-containing protein, partial [Gemmatimonadales bacterium]
MDAAAILAVTNLKVVYPSFTLGPISCIVRGGETVALLGANAAGKTTLLRAITGRLRERQGEILV